MTTQEIFENNVKEYEAWYEKYPTVYESEVLAIQEHIQKLPENLRGIEIGLGTGRFSLPLGIKEGVEPSDAMAQRAVKRGIEVVYGVAEKLPYGDLQFDFALFVTICHLKNVRRAIEEAHRVLKPNGAILIGFLDRDREIAQGYIAKKQKSTFYRKARFYGAEHLKRMLLESGFTDLEFNQTLFGDLEEITAIQFPKPDFGVGSFVVVKAIKK